MKRDADIQKDVIEELSWDRHIDEEIDVTVENGIATLTGHVEATARNWQSSVPPCG